MIDSNSVVGACVFLNKKNHTKSDVRETFRDVTQIMGMGLGNSSCYRLPGPRSGVTTALSIETQLKHYIAGEPWMQVII